MAKNNDSWGIEVGANAIKAMHLVRDGNEVTVADYEVLPFKKILTTPDLNVDEAVQVGLDQLMSRYDMKKSTVVVSVPGHMALARFAKLPPVEPKKVAEIVRFEAHQQIPFPLDQVEWDYQVFQQEDSPEVEVGIFAITKERVAKFLRDYNRVGMRIDVLTLSPLGAYNAMAYDLDLQEDSPGTVFIDIGTSSTDVIIVEAGGVWLRTLPIGGNNFTDALVKAFKLTFPKAEKLKREAGTSKYARQIFQAMRPVFADLVQEVQRSIGYYQSLNRDADLKRVYGIGSTFRLPGLAKFLKQQLQIDVRRLDGFKRLKIAGKREAELTSNALNLATAYGLALQGLGLHRVDANILPKQIIFERMWKAKQPRFAAAAAIVLVAVIAAWFFIQNERSSFAAALRQNDPQIQSVISEGQQLVNKWKEIESGQDPRNRLENFRRIPDYRNLWPHMLQDLHEAIAALNTQEELFTSDYDRIQAIPRDQRRRIYVESYDLRYLPEGAATGRPAAATPGTVFYDDDDNVISGPAPVAEAKPMPRFEITLVGTTPHRGSADFLDSFLSAMKRQQVERNRPYRVIESLVLLADVRPIERARPLDSTRPTPTPGLRPIPRRITEAPQPQTPRRTDGGTLADLLPDNPLLEETGGVDHRFEIRWVVEMLPPEAARLREDPNWRPPAPKPEGDPLEEDEETLPVEASVTRPGAEERS